MAEKDVKIENVVDSLLKGMDSVISTRTVMGDPVQVGEITLIPLMDVSFGFGAGSNANAGKAKVGNAGGLGGKMSPCAVLVIKDGNARIVSVKAQDSVSKVIDMVPDLIDKISDKMKTKNSDSENEDSTLPKSTLEM